MLHDTRFYRDTITWYIYLGDGAKVKIISHNAMIYHVSIGVFNGVHDETLTSYFAMSLKEVFTLLRYHMGA